MTACPADQRITDFVDGQLGAEEAHDFIRHVDGCSGCLSLMTFFAQSVRSRPSAVARPGALPAEPERPEGSAAPRVGAYSIVRLLGSGGMGVVFEAVHEQIGRRVAVKVLRAELAQDSEMVARVLNEARAANLISHPGVVGVSELGQTEGGVPYLVMELVGGESLRGRLRRLGPLGPAALRIGRQIASTLAAVHDRGIVHRDLKPDNVMLVPDPELPEGERPRILDFGMAKVAAALGSEGDAAPRTRSGLLMGTPIYMAPEQCRGAAGVGPRADVYALGVMLYEMVAGRPPFVGTPGEAIAMHQYATPPSLPAGLAVVAPELPALLQRMLARSPGDRPGMAEVATELGRLGASASRTEAGSAEAAPAATGSARRGRGRALLAALVTALLLTGALLSGRIGPPPSRERAAAPVRVDHALPVGTAGGAAPLAPESPPAHGPPPPPAVTHHAPEPRPGAARPPARAPGRSKVQRNEDVELLRLGP